MSGVISYIYSRVNPGAILVGSSQVNSNEFSDNSLHINFLGGEDGLVEK